MLTVDEVVKFFKSVYYGNDEKQKRAFASMMFLVDPKFDNPTEWVKKAIFDFDTNDVFASIRTEMTCDPKMKCLFVKAYRTIVKDKRKNKLDPMVTIEEVTNKVLAMLTV